MCRQCMVEIDTGRGPMLQPSCMITVAPDMKVETDSPTAKRAQEGILELLLANHPLDCPVCDKGGECPLQDQAFTHGPGESRYVEAEAQLREADPDQRPRAARPRALHPVRPLHPLRRRGGRRQADPLHPSRQPHPGQHVPRRAVRLVLLRQRRADLPGRCAHRQAVPLQGPPVGPRAGRVHVHGLLGRLPDLGALEPRRGAARTRASTPATDSVQLGLAVRPRPLRLRVDRRRRPARRAAGAHRGRVCSRPSWSARARHRQAARSSRPARSASLGGARCTNEGAFAWARLADALGIEHRDAQLGDGLPAAVLGLPRATIDEAVAAPTVVLLAPDLKEELPVLYLRLAGSGRAAADPHHRGRDATPPG